MTWKEKDLYSVQKIKDFKEKNGYNPKLKDVQEILGLRALACASYRLKTLKVKGYIDFEDGDYRTIKILKEK